jgi:hypothetical protein
VCQDRHATWWAHARTEASGVCGDDLKASCSVLEILLFQRGREYQGTLVLGQCLGIYGNSHALEIGLYLPV